MDFNYCVGHYWNGDQGSIGVYSYFVEIFYGSLQDAENFLEYVKNKSPDKDWRIFKVVEMDCKL